MPDFVVQIDSVLNYEYKELYDAIIQPVEFLDNLVLVEYEYINHNYSGRRKLHFKDLLNQDMYKEYIQPKTIDGLTKLRLYFSFDD